MENLERRAFDSSQVFELDELVLDMLVTAWYPHIYFKLSFGKSDKIAEHLSASTSAVAAAESIKPWDKKLIRASIASGGNRSNLARYVPYRLLRPFFPETNGKKDSEVNSMVAELCEAYFPSGRPIYKFDSARTGIMIHPLWCKYFEDNLSVVRGWVWWNLLQYMQKCNPNVPAVASKLLPVAERSSLNQQTKYWKTALMSNEFRCIYSGEIVSAEKFALDHFVPWSFVVHDQLWNLIPTLTAVNSKKSNRLPPADSFGLFIRAQHAALACTRDAMSLQLREPFPDSLEEAVGYRS